MYILHDLWDGAINPAEANCPQTKEYWAARHCLPEQENLFRKTLSPGDKQAYEAVQNARIDVFRREERNAFVQGFRLGGAVHAGCTGRRATTKKGL